MACGADREEGFGLAKTLKNLSWMHDLFQLMYVGGWRYHRAILWLIFVERRIHGAAWWWMVWHSCFALATDVPSGATEEGQGLR